MRTENQLTQEKTINCIENDKIRQFQKKLNYNLASSTQLKD